ncbi:hypothetical protein Tfer_0504 [Thermincola ferriacetica]|uniref:Uncharacterized protein n=1 Tax=Thermincola ferriacetica TaxID=281456 RepID=A0A0L6W5M1_9FIRM|nr:hypothetical protein [Thermincola ferriacetica]KNZ70825.1 hypothetical protein Tfer_0504 [Thermincola ferriacetica]
MVDNVDSPEVSYDRQQLSKISGIIINEDIFQDSFMEAEVGNSVKAANFQYNYLGASLEKTDNQSPEITKPVLP